MNPPITIDISNTLSAFSFNEADTKSFCNRFLDLFTDQYVETLNKLVNKESPSIANAYMAGFDTERKDDFTQIFILEGKGESKLALMVETGTSAYDMKLGFENSPKAKKKKNGGWFLTIPFTVATAEAIGASTVFSAKQTAGLQKIARNLQPGQSLNPTNVPKELQNISSREALPNYAPYEHKTFDFQGLQHNTKPNHGGYTMFRRVSDKSDPNSWIHPGFEAHNYLEKTVEEMITSGGVTSVLDQITSEL